MPSHRTRPEGRQQALRPGAGALRRRLRGLRRRGRRARRRQRCRQVDAGQDHLGHLLPDEGRLDRRGPVAIRRPDDATGLGIATVYQDLALSTTSTSSRTSSSAGRSRTGEGHARDRRDRDGAPRARAAERLAVTIPSVRTRSPRCRADNASRSPSPARCWASRRSCCWTSRRRRSASRRPRRCSADQAAARARAGVIVISHNLADVFEVADRIVVLRLGRPAGTFDVDRRPRTRSSPRSPAPSAPTPPPSKGVGHEPAHRDGTGRPRAGPRPRRSRGRAASSEASSRRCGSSSHRGDLGHLPARRTSASSPRSTSPTWCCRSRPGTDLGGHRVVLLLGEIDLSVGAVSGVTPRSWRS